MRGLLEKDFRLIAQRKQTLLMYAAIALMMAMTMDSTYIIGYTVSLCVLLAVGTVSYDEFDNGFLFLMTLPVDRKTYVDEKYLFCILLDLAGWCVATLIYCGIALAQGRMAEAVAELPTLASMMIPLTLGISVMLPIQLKYGAGKSHLALAILFGSAVLVVVGVRRLILSGAASSLGKRLSSLSPEAWVLALSAVSLLVLFGSYLWSRHIMEEKEF